MINTLTIWGAVFLVGMLITHFLSIDPWVAWVAWLVLFFVTNTLVERALKKVPREINHMWMVVNILGVLLTVAFLSGTVPFDESQLMSIWLFLMGAALFANAHQTKNPEHMFIGLVWIAFGLVIPMWFSSIPFLIGGLVLGLPLVIGGLLKK
jgi:hypothetical protein